MIGMTKTGLAWIELGIGSTKEVSKSIVFYNLQERYRAFDQGKQWGGEQFCDNDAKEASAVEDGILIVRIQGGGGRFLSLESSPSEGSVRPTRTPTAQNAKD